MSYFSELSVTINESFRLKAKYSVLYQAITYVAIAIAIWITYLVSEPASHIFGVSLSELLRQQDNGDLFALSLLVTFVILVFLMYAIVFALFGFISYKVGWFNRAEFIKFSLYYRVPSNWLK
jgi:F0F1-type ATP synthase membrane subunit c/vacuolar-type H+-ATPase subunit K